MIIRIIYTNQFSKMEVKKQIKEELAQCPYKLTRLLKQDSDKKVYFAPPNFSIKEYDATKFYQKKRQELQIIHFLTEIEGISSSIKIEQHKNIVHFIQSYKMDNKLCIVRRYQQTDLLNYLNTFYQNKKKKFEEQDLIKIFQQIIEGLQHLYYKRILHRNIKQQNILINSNQEAVITGFGYSMDRGCQLMFQDFGQYFKIDYSYKGKDIWSMGIMYFNILKWIKSDKQKYEPIKTKQQQDELLKNMPPNISPFSQYFFKAMMQQKQNDRIVQRDLFDYFLGKKTAKQIQQEKAERKEREIYQKMNIVQKIKSKFHKFWHA